VLHADARGPLGLLVLSAIGIVLFVRGFGMLKRRRLIMNTPVSKVHSAAIGLVEISGLATGPYSFIAPASGLPAFYSMTTAWQYKQQGKNKEWVMVAQESLYVPFFLDDNTGKVLVDPRGAEMDVHRDFHEEYNSLLSGNIGVPARVEEFLVRHGVDCSTHLKVEECCIKPKNALFVLGTLAQNPGVTVTAGPMRIAPPLVTKTLFGTNRFSFTASLRMGNAAAADSYVPKAEMIVDPVQAQKVALALSKAGVTSPVAWAAAGVTISGSGAKGAAAVAPALDPHQFEVHPPVVLMKGQHQPEFFISWRSQRDVVASLGWKCALMIWGGPALTLLSVYWLAALWGWL
jgi:hypothetical protein